MFFYQLIVFHLSHMIKGGAKLRGELIMILTLFTSCILGSLVSALVLRNTQRFTLLPVVGISKC